ncbi:MAG: phenylalanine--tRNA ligase subunit alpha [Bacilli bacterium]|nr:phenylalanine--tRNA ligase subunit alpha [Bacilli bacterium]MBN2877773.1 phenylalanine--tRNA ligase subunit alpha [Bacilli bacterium]
MEKKLKGLIQELETKLASIETVNDLNLLKAEYLGKKSVFNDLMKQLKDVSNEEKPRFGKLINEAKQEIAAKLDSARAELERKLVASKLKSEAIDVTLPGKSVNTGSKHLISQVIEEVEDIFIGLGYTVKEGPEVESDKYNFEMLNLPKDHPARDMQDSLYISEETLLRTHTSPVQVRSLLENSNQEPMKIICPGKVYRKDDDDQTHSHQFTQVEALVVDEKANLADLKGTLLFVAQKLFGEEREIRLRPSYFPFTEPSVEVDVSCYKCGGVGCSMCGNTGWIEILGAGMVNNNVLRDAGYDPNRFQGFALGMGVERIAILKHGVDDIRAFYTNDLRFNKQFRGK